jgi:hypothetical protein
LAADHMAGAAIAVPAAAVLLTNVRRFIAVPRWPFSPKGQGGKERAKACAHAAADFRAPLV